MSASLCTAGGIAVAALTLGVGVCAAVSWWRRHDGHPLAVKSSGGQWPILCVLGIVLLSRIWVIGMGSAGAWMMIRENWPNITFRELWNRWDAPHYLDIARDGYQVTGDPRFFIVFYPLYPWVVRAVTLVFGDPFWAGVMVSNTCLALSCVVLYRLFCMDMDGESAGWGVIFLCFSPMSFFLSIPYTESLYLLMSVSFFYAARRGAWGWAAMAGFLAALTRNFGVLLLVPLVVYGIERVRRRERKGWAGWAACLVMIPAGLFTYLLVNKVVTGNWTTFLTYQREHWYNQFGFFGANVMRQFEWALTRSWYDVSTVFGPNALSFIVGLGILAYGAKRMPGDYMAYSLAYLIVAYSPTWLLSGGRYMMAVFPLCGILAVMVRGRRARFAVLAVFELLSLYYSMLFAMGQSVL